MQKQFVCPDCGAPLQIYEDCARAINPATGKAAAKTHGHCGLKVECTKCPRIVKRDEMPALWDRNLKRLH